MIFDSDVCPAEFSPVNVVGNRINPHTFFVPRNGIWLCENFIDLVLPYASNSTLCVDSCRIWSLDLAEPSSDAEIVKRLKNSVFEDVDEFLAILAILTGCQCGGEKGQLKNDSNGNIFHLRTGREILAINTFWLKTDSDWNFDAELVSDISWLAGARLFLRDI